MNNKLEIHTNPFTRIILIITGWIFVALGAIGMFLPVMPTTIFLILAAGCFARSSEKFYNWLIVNKYFGKLIKNYRDKRGMPLRAKIIAIVMLNLAIGYSAIFAVETIWVKILLFFTALAVSAYLVSLKTLKENEDPEEEFQET